MKIYIAGKYTGLDHQVAVAKFLKTEAELIAAGIEAADIINPIKCVPEGTDWPTAMRICLHLLTLCNAIFIQSDWQDSLGTRREITIAMQQGIGLYYESQNDITILCNNYNQSNGK